MPRVKEALSQRIDEILDEIEQADGEFDQFMRRRLLTPGDLPALQQIQARRVGLEAELRRKLYLYRGGRD